MKIPLFKIFWDDEDILAVNNVIKSGVYWTTGPTIKEFEKKIAQYMGTKYAVAFSSGTTALHSAIIAHGIKEGDEVIVPSFSFNVIIITSATENQMSDWNGIIHKCSLPRFLINILM